VVKILLVDDNKNIREFCQTELEHEGYVVVPASNGKEALSVIKDVVPDIVILDIRMPEMDGFETMRRILNQQDDIPIIFYTAYKDDLRWDYSKYLVDECVEKSENLDELKHTIERVLQQRKKLSARQKKNLLNYASERSPYLGKKIIDKRALSGEIT